MIDIDTDEFSFPVLDLETAPATSAQVRIDVAALSDKGKVREQNEDHYYVARGGRHVTTLLSNIPPGDIPSQAAETCYLMIVADGMGGHAAGEVASRMAIATLMNIILHVPDWILRLDDQHAHKVIQRAADRCQQIHEALQKQGRLHPDLEGMGTTMTAALSLGDDLFVTQVGDSRAYLFRGGTLQRLTRDQTRAQELADQGVISQQDVAQHRLRHVLTNALGGFQKNVRVDIKRWKLADGDQVLLCSDGLTDMLEDASIAELLGRDADSDETCRRLVDSALEHGGKDNITVVLARYGIRDSGSGRSSSGA